MEASRFALVGSGWRAEFFLRIAAALPDRFQVSQVVTRNREKARRIEQAWNVRTCSDIGALSKDAADFAVACVARPVMTETICGLDDLGWPVLAETPPADSLPDLLGIWKRIAKGARIQVAEQYGLQPLVAARQAVIRSGRIGIPSFAHVSIAHGYHGMSILRQALGVRFKNAEVTARAFQADIVEGPGRDGDPQREHVKRSQQVVAQLDFGDQLGIYDFTGDQYFSWIRSLGFLLRGERGEIRDTTVRYLSDFQSGIRTDLKRIDNGANGNLEGLWHKGFLLGEEWVYRNPFPRAALGDDEIAIASALAGMKDYLDNGQSFYGFADAAQDQMLALAVAEALETGRPVQTTTQPWAPSPDSPARKG